MCITFFHCNKTGWTSGHSLKSGLITSLRCRQQVMISHCSHQYNYHDSTASHTVEWYVNRLMGLLLQCVTKLLLDSSIFTNTVMLYKLTESIMFAIINACTPALHNMEICLTASELLLKTILAFLPYTFSVKILSLI